MPWNRVSPSKRFRLRLALCPEFEVVRHSVTGFAMGLPKLSKALV